MAIATDQTTMRMKKPCVMKFGLSTISNHIWKVHEPYTPFYKNEDKPELILIGCRHVSLVEISVNPTPLFIEKQGCTDEGRINIEAINFNFPGTILMDPRVLLFGPALGLKKKKSVREFEKSI